MKITKTISMGYEEEKKIAEYCKEKNITFSKFIRDLALQKVTEND